MFCSIVVESRGAKIHDKHLKLNVNGENCIGTLKCPKMKYLFINSQQLDNRFSVLLVHVPKFTKQVSTDNLYTSVK